MPSSPRRAKPLVGRYDHVRCLNKRCQRVMGYVPLNKEGRILDCIVTHHDQETLLRCPGCGTPYLWIPARMTEPMRLEPVTIATVKQGA